MAGIYIMLLDTKPGAIDWISYCRAHFLETTLPSSAGIYTLSAPPPGLKSEDEGWMVYMIVHGNTQQIGSVDGSALADMLSPHLPKTFGVIHLQSCATGAAPAKALSDGLGARGHSLVVKAPSTNATFTPEIGFRVIDSARFDRPTDMPIYTDIKKRLGGRAQRLATMSPGGNLSGFCRGIAREAEDFWVEFTEFFMARSQPFGSGWKAYETVPGEESKTLA